MGGGVFNDATYHVAASTRAAKGIDDFAYDRKVRATGIYKSADELTPGKDRRESRDSDEHPNATPVAVCFDVTGSMGGVPRKLQTRLPDLLGLLVREGYADDPQILVSGIGDADSDRVPVQISQFESDNRIDDNLRLIFLEGNGGGQKSESYDLTAWYFLNRVDSDHWDKRGKKGYLFIIGDEMNKPVLKAAHVNTHFGENLTENLSVEELYAALQERWNVYFILPNLTSYYNDPQILSHWQGLLGQNVLRLEDPEAVCDLIATTIGLEEESISLGEGLSALDPKYASSVGTALAHYSPKDVATTGSVSLDIDLT